MRKSFAVFFLATLMLLTACILIGLADINARGIGGYKEGQAVFSYKNTPLRNRAEITLMGEKYLFDYSSVSRIKKTVDGAVQSFEPFMLPHRAIIKAVKDRFSPSFDMLESKVTKHIPKLG